MDTFTQNPSAENGLDTTVNQDPDQVFDRASHMIVPYLRERCAEFRELCVLRDAGWKNPAGDRYFRRQRQVSDNCDEKTANHFYIMMKRLGWELQRATKAFTITPQKGAGPPSILDMCMAPGGFLETALQKNPSASTLAFSLPIASGGHKVLLPDNPKVEQRFLDITMLVTDMGMQSGDDGEGIAGTISPDHPDYGNFVHERQIPPDRLFHIVLCDGQVLRTHIRAPYREKREAQRLTSVQMAIGLEHLRPGGTIIVLMHRLEAWGSVNLIYTFDKFSTVRLFKPKTGHGTRSSFYMVASAVQSQHPEALKVIARWKRLWRIATFGSDEECWEVFSERELSVTEMLERFGDRLVSLGRDVWKTQADALSKAPYIREQLRTPDTRNVEVVT